MPDADTLAARARRWATITDAAGVAHSPRRLTRVVAVLVAEALLLTGAVFAIGLAWEALA